MRPVGVLGIWHETNTYSAHPATARGVRRPSSCSQGDDDRRANRDTGSVIGGFYDEPRPRAGAGASRPAPGRGRSSARPWRSSSRALRPVRAARRPAGRLLVNLHGAMVADNVSRPGAALWRRLGRRRGAGRSWRARPARQPVPGRWSSSATRWSATRRIRTSTCASAAGRPGRCWPMCSGAPVAHGRSQDPVAGLPAGPGDRLRPDAHVQERARARARAAGIRRVSVAGGFAYSDVASAHMSQRD